MKLLSKVKTLSKKKIIGIILVIVILCSVSILLVRFTSTPDSTSVTENQVATVQRGDLTVDITAAGNLALSVIEDLAFEISGTVEEVLVEEGESVEEGQLLAKLDTSEWEDELRALELGVTAKERDLLQAEINLENAELALDKAEDDTSITSKEIDIKELQVELAEARLEDAEEELEEAEEELEEALDASPEIIAPFDGFITSVNVSGGDEVTKGTVAVTIADPNEFEADILVSEMDIFQVKLGGKAWVQVEAMQGLSLPAEVTHISPTATIQSGVVNYTVKVELQALERIAQEQLEAMPDISSGEIPDFIQQAIDAGEMTQEEAEAMMEQMQGGQMRQMGQTPTMTYEDIQLREGLTVTVSLVVEEATDVLLVPNGAITTRGGQTYVQVLSADGSMEERAVKTGISNWQYTEVTDGLSEGEQVVVPQGTTTTSTTEQQDGFPGGEMFFFRGGGP
jgi:RND family efflux transporter MFP subunit